MFFMIAASAPILPTLLLHPGLSLTWNPLAYGPYGEVKNKLGNKIWEEGICLRNELIHSRNASAAVRSDKMQKLQNNCPDELYGESADENTDKQIKQTTEGACYR
jgi:hypothetical protein